MVQKNETKLPAATEAKKAATGAATQVVGEKRNENEFGCKIQHENENILTLFAKNEPKHFPHYGNFEFLSQSNRTHFLTVGRLLAVFLLSNCITDDVTMFETLMLDDVITKYRR